MSKKLVLALFVLLIFTLLFKFPLGDKFSNLLCLLNLFDNSAAIARFLGIFLFPFLLSLFFLYCLLKHKDVFFIATKWILLLIIASAIFFAFHGLFWAVPSLGDNFPILGGLFGVLILGETYFSVSLLLLFITLLFFAFGKKSIPKESNI